MKTLTATTAVDFAAIVAPVQSRLQEIDRYLAALLTAEDPALAPMLGHLQLMSGKRIRPLLCLLAAASCGTVTGSHVPGAAAVELVHLATLVHDDLIDGADLRRQQTTIHQKFGVPQSVLLGDFLFTQSFAEIAKTQSLECVALLSQCSQSVCIGEMKQNLAAGASPLSCEQYLDIVAGKTGGLCRAACGIGAIVSGASSAQTQALQAFGTSLGIAFQIIDDCLDLVGQDSVVGKTLGTDLRTRKWTLPLILGIEHRNPALQNEIRRVWNQAESAQLETLNQLLMEAGAIEAAEEVARQKLDQAIRGLGFIAIPEIRQSFEKLAQFVLVRKH